MKFILDSSVAFKWVIPEFDTDKAIRLRDEYRNGAHDLISPDVFSIELVHALTRAERQGRITPPESGILWQDVMTIASVLEQSLPLIPHAIAISSAARKGVYDCVYIALAYRENCEFVTADAKLVNDLQSQFPFIISLSSLP